uniref:Uncharacterized protein n=1 Tax=Anguilla anguilla TaxID=7936 RepID=A0A0E9RGX3_ANGAN
MMLRVCAGTFRAAFQDWEVCLSLISSLLL